jgi:hypothetical protein
MPAMWFALTMLSFIGLLVVKSETAMIQLALAMVVFFVLLSRSALKWVVEEK